jgi:hypothetical protein
VLVLDMGEPVRIADIARRLAAQSPHQLDIVYTGLRAVTATPRPASRADSKRSAMTQRQRLAVQPKTMPLIACIQSP